MALGVPWVAVCRAVTGRSGASPILPFKRQILSTSNTKVTFVFVPPLPPNQCHTTSDRGPVMTRARARASHLSRTVAATRTHPLTSERFHLISFDEGKGTFNQ